MSTTINTIIIGAGQAGLSASRELQNRDIEHLVLERGRVGESWRSQRWDGFRLNTPNWSNTLPDSERDALGDPDGFASAAEWADYLNQFVRSFDLPVRENTEVRSILHIDGSYQVVATSGESWTAENIVVCSGIQNVPVTPEIAERLPARVHQMHSADYRSPDALPGGAVLVVGSGQSGAQIAEELGEASRRTFLCTSRVSRAPRRYRGRDIVTWGVEAGMMDTTLDQLPDPNMRYSTQAMISGVDGGRSLSLHSVASCGVTLLGRFLDVDGERVSIGDELLDHVEVGEVASANVRAMIDQMIEALGTDAPPPTPDPADVVCEELETMAAIRSLDLAGEGVSTVIWATGYRGDFGFFDFDVGLDERGEPAHTDGVGTRKGLYFLGFPWLRNRGSGIVYGTVRDAGALCDALVRHTATSPK